MDAVQFQHIPWTPEREAEMTQLWRDGYSAAAIAKRMGGTTRNAVIGKVSRLKLGTRDRAWRPTERAAPKPQERRTGRKHRTQAEILADAQANVGRPRGPSTDKVHGNAGHANVQGILKRAEQRRKEAEGAPDPAMLRLLKSEVWSPLEDRVPIPLEQLGNRDCRWPLGDPLVHGFGFCGLPAEGEHSRYCALHRRVSVEGAV